MNEKTPALGKVTTNFRIFWFCVLFLLVSQIWGMLGHALIAVSRLAFLIIWLGMFACTLYFIFSARRQRKP
jgi:hypothetical protein